LLVPSLFGAIIGYVEPIFDKSLASHMEEGAIAALSFAGRPMAILSRIAVYSFVTALLPVLSWESLHGNKAAFKTSVLRILNMLMFAIIPLSLLLIALRVPIIQFLFERGKFDAQATEVTSNIFAALVLGLMPMAASVTLSSVFIAQEDTKTPALWGAGGSVIAKIILSLALIAPLGIVGLALATSLKSLVTTGLLLYRLRDRLGGIDGGYLLKALGRIVSMSLVAVSPVWLIKMDFGLSPLISILVGSLIFTALYALLSIILRAPEIAIVSDFLPRFRRT
jgi:putative peptidoglycan lipid II flippase